MMTIDSDAHVIECEHTWDYLEGSDKKYRPGLASETAADGSLKQYWVIEGRAHGQGNVGLNTPKESREMADIEARLRHMDELEIDVQVLYPSLFLRPLSRKPEVELALCRTYNRWMADIWSHSKNRLRWVALPPMLSEEEMVQELKWARDNGACGVFMRGIEYDLTLDNPFFFRLYETVSDLDVPIGIHAGNNSFFWNDMFADEGGYSRAKFPVMSAFHSVVMSGLAKRFPGLRIGFIEAASQWIPGAIHDAARRLERRRGEPFDRFSVLRENRLFVACQTDDDLGYILKYAGEDNLVMGTDYGHNDTATEIDALRHMRHDGGVSAGAINKILDDNARALYGL
jgi:predicted TIM-barrel fold metal-dependent hydrolase